MTPSVPLSVPDLDALPAAAAREALRPAADVGWWLDELVATRPHRTREALLASAAAAADRWSGEDAEAALADHPRIGERATGEGAGAGMSRREQAGVDPASEVAARIAEGNRRYEERFGRIFLIRAAGRSAEEILALLERRLTDDPATELATTTEQLREIALLRLEATFTED